MNCEPKNERHMPYKIEPPQVDARAHCVINGTEKCCGSPWWDADDLDDNGLPPESDERGIVSKKRTNKNK